MAYVDNIEYLRVFDRAQAPIFLNALASRYSGPAKNTTEGVYIDFGCASGHSVLALASLYPDIHFFGIDFNHAHIQSAKEEAGRLGLANVDFVEADFRSLPPDLPKADYLVVNGIYSWLSQDVKAGLESALLNYAKPHALLKLHYCVYPGGALREVIGKYLQSCISEDGNPASGRDALQVLSQDAHPFFNHFTHSKKFIENMSTQPDALWHHDILNKDFTVEYAEEVIERFENLGFTFLCSTQMDRNILKLHVTDRYSKFIEKTSKGKAQNLIDIFTCNDIRNDLFVLGKIDGDNTDYSSDVRFGITVPSSRLSIPFQTSHVKVIFQSPLCQEIWSKLVQHPLTFKQLSDSLPHINTQQLQHELDLLIACHKVSPFLPTHKAASTDLSRLREINRKRLEWTVSSLNVQSKTPLLCAEYGNCLIAGWFESLVLSRFSHRHDRKTQIKMLNRIHKSGMAFPGPDGKPDKDQFGRFLQELNKLESEYISHMGYWGLAV